MIYWGSLSVAGGGGSNRRWLSFDPYWSIFLYPLNHIIRHLNFSRQIFPTNLAYSENESFYSENDKKKLLI